jgi:hypothetical protein
MRKPGSKWEYMKLGNKLVLFLLVLVPIVACRTNRNITRMENRTEKSDATGQTVAERGMKYHESLKLRKAGIKISLNGNEETANVTIAIIRDSIIVVSVVALAGIEAMRIYCTRDSLTIINRSDKTYSHSAIDRIREKYRLTIDYEGLQAALSNEFFLYGTSKSAEYQINDKVGDDKNSMVEYRMRDGMGENIMQQVFFDRQEELLKKVNITDYKRKVLLVIEYEDFTDIEEISFPRQIKVGIDDPGNKIAIEIRAERIEIDQEVRIREIIPGGYKRIEL